MGSTSPQGAGAAVALIERLPSALLIAGASAASYWLAHTYEAAYLGYFGLPASLVHVGTNTMIVAAGAALSVIWFAFTLAVPVAEMFRKWQPGTDVMLYVTVALFRAFASLYIDPGDWHVWLEQGGLIAFLIALLVGIRRFERWSAARAKKSAEQAQKTPRPQTSNAAAPASPPVQPPPHQPSQTEVPSSQTVPMQVASPAVARVLMPWIGREGLVLIFVLFQAQAVARDAARAEARKAEAFFTFAAPRPHVVLRAYDDVLVAAPLDRARHEVANEVLLLPVAKQGELALRWEPVGHLTPADPNRPEPDLSQSGSEARSTQVVCLSCHPG